MNSSLEALGDRSSNLAAGDRAANLPAIKQDNQAESQHMQSPIHNESDQHLNRSKSVHQPINLPVDSSQSSQQPAHSSQSVQQPLNLSVHSSPYLDPKLKHSPFTSSYTFTTTSNYSVQDSGSPHLQPIYPGQVHSGLANPGMVQTGQMHPEHPRQVQPRHIDQNVIGFTQKDNAENTDEGNDNNADDYRQLIRISEGLSNQIQPDYNPNHANLETIQPSYNRPDGIQEKMLNGPGRQPVPFNPSNFYSQANSIQNTSLAGVNSRDSRNSIGLPVINQHSASNENFRNQAHDNNNRFEHLSEVYRDDSIANDQSYGFSFPSQSRSLASNEIFGNQSKATFQNDIDRKQNVQPESIPVTPVNATSRISRNSKFISRINKLDHAGSTDRLTSSPANFQARETILSSVVQTRTISRQAPYNQTTGQQQVPRQAPGLSRHLPSLQQPLQVGDLQQNNQQQAFVEQVMSRQLPPLPQYIPPPQPPRLKEKEEIKVIHFGVV